MKFRALMRVISLICISALLLPALASCGNGESSGDSSAEESSQEQPLPITVGEHEFLIKDKINSELTEDGVYLYTYDASRPAFPKREDADKSFFDVAVLDGRVVAVYDNGSTAVIPKDGFVLRFRNVEAEVCVGNEVKCDFLECVNYPERYVQFGNGSFIEIGYENQLRTAEDTGWLYNENWHTGNTESNIYCTEIAVKDGKIVEINRSGDDIAGISIPEGGFVLAVGQGSQNERKANKLRVGDSAEIVRDSKLYSSVRFNSNGENRSRPDDGLVIFTDKQKTTPVGSELTELSVSSEGRITAIYTHSGGMNKIESGGYVLSASGTTATELARTAELQAEVVRQGERAVFVIKTPLTELARLIAERDALIECYKQSVEKLERIDFELVAGIISKISESVSSAEATLGIKNEGEYNGFDGSILSKSLHELKALVKQAKNELVPYVSVQDRSAWITIGEYDASGKIFLHCKTQADVNHAVRYAKNCGLNTIIIDNLAAGFAVYPSEVEGLVMLPQLEGVDIIAAFKKACDENQIRLIVMVNAFSSGLSHVSYPKNHYMSIYKDKYLLTNKGNHIGPDGVITLDPADKDVQAFNLAIISEIAEKYDIYGVQADYMRYPLPYYYQLHNYEDFGYNESSKSGFIAKYGKDPAKMRIDDPLWEKWCEHRRNIISDYQKRFYQTLKGINSNLFVSFTCFADYRDRQIYVYQDVEKWAENGFADAIYPMIYGETTEYQLGYAQEIQPITEHTDLILGVGTYVRATNESLTEQFVMPFSLCSEGISIFTLRYISTCGYDETVRNAFRVPATPATAPDGELISACAEMAVWRINGLKYALRFSNGLDESEGKALEELAEGISELGSAEDDFLAFCSSLSDLRGEIALGSTEIPEELKDAILAELDYIISLA